MFGRKASGGAVGEKNAVPAAFKTVGMEGVTGGEVAGLGVEDGGAALGRGTGDDDLGADEESVGFGSGRAEDLLVECRRLNLI